MSACGIARTGAEALKFAINENVDVVFMDCRVPDMTAAALAGAIRSQIPEVALVFHNAEGIETAVLGAIHAGATAFLTRSAMTRHEIVAAVRRVVRNGE